VIDFLHPLAALNNFRAGLFDMSVLEKKVIYYLGNGQMVLTFISTAGAVPFDDCTSTQLSRHIVAC
jgi:hypothetical protein